jgi:hypothetical protein
MKAPSSKPETKKNPKKFPHPPHPLETPKSPAFISIFAINVIIQFIES